MVLIGISIFVFVLLHSVFPSPAIVVLGPKAAPKDYIRTARAKGMSERLVLFRHLLRNACLPMIADLRIRLR